MAIVGLLAPSSALIYTGFQTLYSSETSSLDQVPKEAKWYQRKMAWVECDPSVSDIAKHLVENSSLSKLAMVSKTFKTIPIDIQPSTFHTDPTALLGSRDHLKNQGRGQIQKGIR